MSDLDLSQLAVDRTPGTELAPSQRNLLSRYVLPLMLLAGFATLVGWAGRDSLFPPRDVKVIPVLATEAAFQSEGTELFQAAGWIEPRPTSIRVAALASGIVEQLLVVEDQPVKAGEPIAELVKEDAELAFQRCVADRELMEAELERAKATLVAATTRFDQPVHLQAELAQADTMLARINTMLKNLPFETQRAKSQLTFAESDYRRNIAAGLKAVSQREVDQSKTDFETARALMQELKDRDSSLRNEATAIGQRREALNVQLQLLIDEIKDKDESAALVRAGEARVQQMKVAEAEAKLRLNRMTVRAPVDGRVYQLFGLPGARVGNGVMTAMDGHDGGTVVTMYQPKSLQIGVDVRFEDIPKVSLGQPVRIDNPSLADPIEGSVLFISSEADIQKNTLEVKVDIDDPPEFFKPEMLVDVTFLAPKQINQSADAKQELRMFVPEQYIHQHDGSPIVWMVDQSAGIAIRKQIKTGRASNAGLMQVIGLPLGSRIVTSGIEGLRDGQRIRITGEEN